jgi:LPXTG-motif cell wall-anchored protein
VRIFRLAALGTVLAMLAALLSVGSAGAATQGVGTSSAGTSVLQLDLANLLSARVLGDDSRSSIDKAIGVPEAATVLRPLTLTSGTLPALNKEIAPVEARSQSGPKQTSYSADLGSLAPQILSGTLTPADLSALVDATGAKSGMLDTLTNLVVGGGLATVNSVQANLGTLATKDASNGSRTLDVGAITGLDLGALLRGLGLPLNALPLPTIESLTQQVGALGAGGPVAGLLTTLGIAGPVPTNAAGVNTIVTGLQSRLTDASTALTALNGLGALCDNVVPLSSLLTPLPASLGTFGVLGSSTCQSAVTTITAAQTADRAHLGGLLAGLLTMLDGIKLLSIDGITAGITSKATDSVSTSAAAVTARIGALKVANLASLPAVDLGSTVKTITDTTGSVTSQLDGILGAVNPGLAGMVSLKLLDTSGTGVTKGANGYIQSVAKLTGVDLGIVPPANLAAIVGSLPVPASSTGGILTAIPGFATLPALPGTSSMSVLGTVLSAGSPVNALAGGARLRLASINGVANFLPSAAAAPAPTSATLPRTGGNTTAFAIVGAIMALLALAIRRRVLAPVRAD